MKYLNLGCGSRFHPYWINVDMYAADDSVLVCNFLNGLPFANNYFDVVYHSHVLEHFTSSMGKRLIEECYRVLKPGGIIRIACPDLEKIAKEYLHHLERLDNNERDAESDYDWIMLELYDQTVRNISGGEMKMFINDERIKNKSYVVHRIGESSTQQRKEAQVPSFLIAEIKSLKEEIKKKEGRGLINNLGEKIRNIKDRLLISLLSKPQKETLEIGKFRMNGEIHQWMYDRFSTKRLLERCGFTSFKLRTAQESFIENWADFQLDNPSENASLFVEAIKPN